jgi:hypothetical protein
MPNYQDGKIYMIESISNNCRYYGSTVDTLSRRLAKHRNTIKVGKNPSSKKVLKYSDARILLVELFPCNSKMELEAKEAEYIRNNDCVNKHIPQRTQKEYYQDNKEVIDKYQKQYKQQYYQDNKEVIAEKTKQYCQDNKEHLQQQKKQYYQDNKEVIAEKTKQYRATHKEVIAKYKKQYHQDNKEVIAEKQNKKCLCECGKIYIQQHYKRHTRSKRHTNWQKIYDFIIS